MDVEEKELARVKLDFDQLESYKNKDGMPITSFLGVYEESGITKPIKEYIDNGGAQVAPIDNILCNFYTLQRLKNFIENNWKTYSLDIQEDNKVVWNEASVYGKEKHYPKKVKARVRNSIRYDFANFCPGIDDDLEDNVLVFKIYLKKDDSPSE